MMPWKIEEKISRSEAERFGETSNSSAISFAIGPAITIATVLFAVETSTSPAIAAMPSSAPFF